MTVFLVIASGIDYCEVMGAYSSTAKAREQHPGKWEKCSRRGEWRRADMQPPHCCVIEPHRVDNFK